MTAQEVIEELKLLPLHSEGGYYSRVWYAPEKVPPPHEGKAGTYRSSSAIYYLITSEDHGFSHLHSLKSHELWHFYGGSSVEMHLFTPGKPYESSILGMELTMGERPLVPVMAGCWMAARLKNPAEGSWALVGNSLAPSFEIADYQEPSLNEMLDQWPEQEGIIKELIPSGGQG